MSDALGTSRKTASVSRFSPKFLITLSNRRANCRDVLCLSLKPNCSSRSSSRPLTSFKILLSRIFKKPYQSYLKDLWADRTRVVSGPSRISGWKSLGRASMLVENTAFWGTRWKAPQVEGLPAGEDEWEPCTEYRYCLVPCWLWETGWHLEPPGGWLTWARLWVHMTVHKPINYPNNRRVRRLGYRMQLSHKAVG